MTTPITIAALERRLRLAAPDEPAVLPPLRLPDGVGEIRRVSVSTRFLPAPAARRSPALSLALVLLALVAAGGIIAGTLRLLREPTTPLNQLRWPPAEGVLGIQDGFSMSWPEGWHRLAEGGLEQGDFTQSGIAYERVAIILASVELPGCAPGGSPGGPNVVPSGEPLPLRTPDPLVVCLRSAQLPAGAVRVSVEVGQRSAGLQAANGPATPDTSEPSLEAGWTELVDGQPTRLTVISGAEAATAGATESLVWDVVFPATIDHLLRFRADLGAGDLAAAREAAREVLESIEFDTPAPNLGADAASSAIRKAIDGLDRTSREQYRSDFYTCLPREAGSTTGRISSTPWQLFAMPVDVTCSTAIEPSRTGLWRVTLTIRWQAGDGYPAGGVAQELFVGAEDPFQTAGNFGAIDASGTVTPDGMIPWPEPWPDPVEGGPPPALAPGSIIEVVGPAGLAETAGGETWLETERGWRATVIGGALVGGTEWYPVLWDEPSRPFVGWLPAVFMGQTAIGLAPSRCPVGAATLEDVRWLTSGERLDCFGSRELSLGPVVLTAAEPDVCLGEGDVVTTCPPTPADWRDDAATHLVFGPGGPDGPVPSISAWLAPGVDAPPLQTQLRVHGHFDDARANGCSPWSGDLERLAGFAAAAAALECRVRFVITGFELAAGS